MSGHWFRPWAATLSAGLLRGFGGPSLCLFIQSQLPAFAVADGLPPGAPQSPQPAIRGASLQGVQP